MPFLNADVQGQVRQALAGLTHPVTLVLFTQGAGGQLSVECAYCSEARELLEEVAALSDKLTLDVKDFVADAELARQYGVDKIPALAVTRGGPQPKDYGIRLYGVPSGYEFATLIEDIKLVSRGEVELAAPTRAALAQLTKPVHIQVYVTPTCPHCPRAVVLAHKLALASDLVTADMVEASEFPHLANRYQVYGVPRTVIDDVIHIEGAAPEAQVISRLLQVLDDGAMAQLRRDWEASLN
jgi:glutaredoxin-like protein